MPYEKVCLLVAMVVTVILSVLLSGNFAKDAKVVIIDLDNSAYTRELTTRIDASEYMQVTAVLNTPVDPKTLFYEDKAVAVVYFPRDLEKNRFTGSASNIGVYYDNTNTAQTANIKEALNELLALDNAAASGDVGSTNDSVAGQVQLADRKLFKDGVPFLVPSWPDFRLALQTRAACLAAVFCASPACALACRPDDQGLETFLLSENYPRFVRMFWTQEENSIDL